MSSNIPDLNWRPPYVELETSKGKLVIELNWNSAPETCRNFATLTKRKYFDDTKIHRIVANRIIQAGDPTGTGKGGESIYGGYFKDEIDPNLKHDGPGVVAMANARGPNMNKSQFYITLATLQSLDNKATIFGRVISGLEVLQKIGQLKVDKFSFPLEDVRILKANILESLAPAQNINEEEEDLEDEDANPTSFFTI